MPKAAVFRNIGVFWMSRDALDYLKQHDTTGFDLEKYAEEVNWHGPMVELVLDCEVKIAQCDLPSQIAQALCAGCKMGSLTSWVEVDLDGDPPSWYEYRIEGNDLLDRFVEMGDDGEHAKWSFFCGMSTADRQAQLGADRIDFQRRLL